MTFFDHRLSEAGVGHPPRRPSGRPAARAGEKKNEISLGSGIVARDGDRGLGPEMVKIL